MKTISLSEDTDELIARAQAIATVLAEKRDELGISTDVEALLRASIAAVDAINGYVALTAARNPGSVLRQNTRQLQVYASRLHPGRFPRLANFTS